MLINLTKICLYIRDILLHPIEYSNQLQSTKHFYSTPLPYAIGTCSEDIRHTLDAAKALNKKPVLVCLPNLEGVLQFTIAAKSLFKVSIEQNVSSEKKGLTKDKIVAKIITTYVISIFIISRVAFLILKYNSEIRSRRKQGDTIILKNLLDTLSFPRLGCARACTILYEKLIEEEKFKENLLVNSKERKIRFSNSCYVKWERYLESIKFDIKSNFIVIHTRSQHYHRDEGRRSFRNASINNYNKLIDRLLERGYKVVLVGGSIQEHMNIKNDALYDLRCDAQNKKPCSLDVYLIANCTKYIGMQSGPLDLALLFGRETYVLNTYTAWYCVGYPAKTIFLMQNHKDSGTKEYCGVSNLSKRGVKLIGLNDLKLEGYELTQLSADTLLQFCDEVILNKSISADGRSNGWNDITDEVRASIYNFEYNKVVNDNKAIKHEATYRWKVNSILSDGNVRIYEGNR